MEIQPQSSQKSDSNTAKLLQILNSNHPLVRSTAARRLAKIRSQAAVIGLLKAFAVGDSNVRGWAAWALGEIGSSAIVTKMLQALEHKNYDVRIWATWVLGKIGSEAAVMGLLKALKHPDDEVRWRAATALGNIASEATVTALLEALKDPDDYVRGKAAFALGKIGTETATNGLLQALYDRDQYVRFNAVSALQKIASPSAIGGLIKALDHPYCNVRADAVYALGEIGSLIAVPGIVESVKDQDLFVRAKAANALGKFTSPLAIAALAEALSDREVYVRTIAISTLKNMSDNNIIAPLRETLLSALAPLLTDENAAISKIAAELSQKFAELPEKTTLESHSQTDKIPGINPILLDNKPAQLPTLFIASFDEASEHIFCPTKGSAIKHLISIGSPGLAPPDGFNRIAHRLRLEFHDIDIPHNDPTYILATPDHITQAINFVASSQFDGHLLVHCQAGISRSSAIALTVCAQLLGAGKEEDALAYVLAARPQAMPNLWVVELADVALGRKGKLLKVVQRYQQLLMTA